jgi:nanoRNase/pAp phosphatase (c-di-AMP/oligoRNAs hydrolase)
VPFEGEARLAPSTARIIYEYYGGEAKLPHFAEMVEYVDKVDSADLTKEEILNPTGWILLGFIMDPRSGFGRFRNFTISNYSLMEKLIDSCRQMSIDEILAMPDIKERIDIYYDQQASFKEMIQKHTRIEGNVIVTDLRGVDPIYTGNRFLIYSLYPEQNVSAWVVDGRQKQNCSIAVGHSILNHSCNTNVGHLMLKYGGGGHHRVGTAQVSYDDTSKVLEEMVEYMKNLG